LPGSKVYFPTINFAWSILYYIVFIIIVQKQKTQKFIMNYCNRHINLIKIIGTALAAVIAFNVAYSFTKPPEMQVHFIDVHQGDCALVITPHGHAMMFDTGGVREHTFDIGSRVDIPYLHHYGITELDYIFLTHAHEDHAAGAGSIIKKIPVKQIITAGESKSDYAASMAISETSPELKNMRRADEGEIFGVDGVTVEVLYAPQIAEGVSITGNEVSNVYKVTFKDVSFLFTGDLVKENEQVILHENKNVRSTVLKVGHHGSKTSSSKEFIEAVKPEYAVFCVGANNNFGHPRPEVLELIKDSGAKIYRTDKNGAIIFYTNGHKIDVDCFIN
ncbi:MAG: MBL fold metallo-hydrolase, partial [Selenomonadaceae bacterium]|nr:MBL fold metallo-hydrolase [Selenomonadaceae bacterium]